MRMGRRWVDVLRNMVQLDTDADSDAEFAASTVRLMWEHKGRWDYRRIYGGALGREYRRDCQLDAEQGRIPLTPWTQPTIDDVAIIVEMLVYTDGNERLCNALRALQTL